MPVGVDVPGWVIGSVQVPMQARRLGQLAQVRVLGEEASQLGIEVSSFGVVELGFGIEVMTGEN